MRPLILSVLPVVVLAASCGTDRKAMKLVSDSVSADISISVDERMPQVISETVSRDTLIVTDNQGNETLIMHAVRDEGGEMVATDVIEAARVTARFRNVAERHGRVDLSFDVTVPARMRDDRWQIRLYPTMHILADTVSLEPLIVTGREYRQTQLRGYQQYQRFLRSLVSDSDAFVDRRQLEIFLRRNIPSIYAYRNDTTFVSDEKFHSSYDVTQHDALVHYTNSLMQRYNAYRHTLTDRKYRRYVKSPIITEGIRLDTVLVSDTGDFTYRYTQSMSSRPKLRKVDIILDGEIFEQEKKVYSLPESGPLTFYISSLSTFADAGERYLTRVIERNVSVNTACYIDFRQGSCDIDRHLSTNADELSRIEDNITSLLCNETMVMDSIVVTASASPEGSFRSNAVLSERRSEAVSGYMKRHIHDVSDSLTASRGVFYDEHGNRTVPESRIPKISFISRSVPENWTMLDAIVSSDDSLSADAKAEYSRLSEVSDPDGRDLAMCRYPWYKYVRSDLYPRLRTVRFDFFLHRRGMQKDTVHTTVVDSAYMRGVKALKDMDYETAVTILRPYKDFNSAIAFCAMDYNASAMEILQEMDKSPRVNYMLALVHSRLGDERSAVECYLRACAEDPAFVHRGNLDPEIYYLISKYSIDPGSMPETNINN